MNGRTTDWNFYIEKTAEDIRDMKREFPQTKVFDVNADDLPLILIVINGFPALLFPFIHLREMIKVIEDKHPDLRLQ